MKSLLEQKIYLLQDLKDYMQTVKDSCMITELDNYFCGGYYECNKGITDLSGIDFCTCLNVGYFTYRNAIKINPKEDEIDGLDITVYFKTIDTSDIMNIKIEILDVALKIDVLPF